MSVEYLHEIHQSQLKLSQNTKGKFSDVSFIQDNKCKTKQDKDLRRSQLPIPIMNSSTKLKSKVGDTSHISPQNNEKLSEIEIQMECFPSDRPRHHHHPTIITHTVESSEPTGPGTPGGRRNDNKVEVEENQVRKRDNGTVVPVPTSASDSDSDSTLKFPTPILVGESSLSEVLGKLSKSVSVVTSLSEIHQVQLQYHHQQDSPSTTPRRTSASMLVEPKNPKPKPKSPLELELEEGSYIKISKSRTRTRRTSKTKSNQNHHHHLPNYPNPIMPMPMMTPRATATKLRIKDTSPPLKNNKKFTLYPSSLADTEFLDEGDMKKIEIRSSVSKMIEEDRLNLLGPPILSKLIITKQFQFFPNRNGDHHICYFMIKNKSCEIQAYSVNTNRPNGYSITPRTAYVPPGRSMNVCLKILTRKISGRQLEKDCVIVKSFVSPPGVRICPNLLQEFERLEEGNQNSTEDSNPGAGQCNKIPVPVLVPTSSTTFQLKNFVVHPCSIVSSRATQYNMVAAEESLPHPPLSASQRRMYRFQKLRNRNFGEKVFHQVQTATAVSLNELKICRQRTQLIGKTLAVMTYLMFISTLGFAAYLSCCYGAKLKGAPAPAPLPVLINRNNEEANKNRLGLGMQHYSNSYNIPINWLYYTGDYLYSYFSKNILSQWWYSPQPEPEPQPPSSSPSLASVIISKSFLDFDFEFSNLYRWASAGFQTFVQHPISFCLNWVTDQNPF